ncbi:MAG: hypothetical protein HOF74_01220 [Gammaproteobacteria bacterium]|nr:hypothetical protein [Gammaproteobacteria bacterium]MBT3858427.1 hypothetical protein [Gammaproteobacteria bacterium]MBT3986835.1 hypothetical protein [Gammaproteobacteria bacterium]MBT4581215.1 hypothetical protein [Gammaproteobacteria bacterium]MBT4657654.1 hypothetical protein [Gammaproteobacteria bacterium]
MKILKIALQVIGFVVLIGAVSIGTLRIQRSSADGATVVFPGGEMVSGELHSGPEPDWGFTDDIFTIELQLNDPMATRRIFILESEGKIYVVSGYMKSFLGKIWKEWAFDADEGNDEGVLRVNNVRYPRKLVRIEQGDVLNGVSAKLLAKYSGVPTPVSDEAIAMSRADIEDGNSWIFELTPR